MKDFKYKCVVSKNGNKMYYKRVNGKWKRISNKTGMNVEKENIKYRNNDCFDYITLDDEKVNKWLLDDVNNFVLKTGKKNYCMSLGNIKAQLGKRIWYECKTNNNLYGPDNVIKNKKYIKLPPDNLVIRKPIWFYKGPIPQPKIFKTIDVGEKVKALVSNEVLAGGDVVSADHCNHTSDVIIYRLVRVKFPIFVPSGCKKCFTPNNKDWNFCPHCGEKIIKSLDDNNKKTNN